MKRFGLRSGDLRGAARLSTDAVLEVTRMVEAMHARIASPLRLGPADSAAAGRTRGLTGLVYGSVRGVTRLAGRTTQAVLAGLEALLSTAASDQPTDPDREAVLAALNGVLGDHLTATANPLALSMSLRQAGRPLWQTDTPPIPLNIPAKPQVLILVHGLCMNDLQWQRKGHDHGQALAEALGYTPVYLHYNTGLAIWRNGEALSRALELLCAIWPMPVERLVMLGHSMGGLVGRSALHAAAGPHGKRLQWRSRVSDLICLGSPHLGAPLERLGHGLEGLLEAAPYASPLAGLARVRSAGIQDLRQGRILRPGRSTAGRRSRDAMALPEGVQMAVVAACLDHPTGRIKGRLLGDGLVPVASALGHHRLAHRGLGLPPDRQALVWETSHLDLLSSPAVYDRLRRWLL